jgi:hypothetical protein
LENITDECFAATGFNYMFSGSQQRQNVKFDGSVEQEALVLLSYQQHPEEWAGVSPWNVVEPSRLDAAVCPRRFKCIG